MVHSNMCRDLVCLQICKLVCTSTALVYNTRYLLCAKAKLRNFCLETGQSWYCAWLGFLE